MKAFIKFFIALLLIPSCVAGTLYWLNSSGFFKVTELNVVIENANPQPQYLRPYIVQVDEFLESFRGQSLWSLNLDELVKTLMLSDWIEDVSISRRWPSTLAVSIKAKDLALMLVSSSGSVTPITARGEKLNSVEIHQAPDVVILRGEKFEKKSDLLKRATEVIQQIPTEGAFSQKTISEMHYDEKDGFWMSLIPDGVRVKLGHDQFAIKSARVSQVLDYMKFQNQKANSIDANLSKKVMVRLKSE